MTKMKIGMIVSVALLLIMGHMSKTLRAAAYAFSVGDYTAVFNFNDAAGPTPPTGTSLQIISKDGYTGVVSEVFGSGGGFLVRTTNGTAAAPTAITTGKSIGAFGARGFDGTNYAAAANATLAFTAAQDFTATQQGAYADIWTTPLNTTVRQITLSVRDTGLIFNGNTGLTTTKTVRTADGLGTCTLIYSGGLLTGGTC